MTIRVRCPQCSYECAFDDVHEDSSRRCEQCDANVRVPPLVRYACHDCGRRYVSGPQHIGKRFACRSCHTTVLVPNRSTPSSGKEPGESTGDDWFAGAPVDAMPKLGPDDAEAALAPAHSSGTGVWLAAGIVCALAALAVVPPFAAGCGVYCGVRVRRLNRGRGRAVIVANAVTGVIGVALGIAARIWL